jgi:DNA-binding transcriptional regulator YbjK
VTETNRRPRRYDPERRNRIADAALRIVTRHGVEALTHRAVAAAADVPVGSTTYHFADKDELLLAAIEVAEARSADVLPRMFLECGPEEDLAAAIAKFLELLTVRDREQLYLDYEIFLAARRRPALRRTAERWIEDCYEMLLPYAGGEAARVVTDVVEGLLAQAVVFGRELTAEETLPRFRWILRR